MGNIMKWTAVVSLALVAAVCALAIAHGTADATEWTKWQGVKQASYYSGYGSASGIKAKNKLAVPISKVVSKKKWTRGSAKYRKSHFYYGEKVQLRVVRGRYKGKVRTFTVVDCGRFGSCGCTYKGKWRARWFDLHRNGIAGFLGTSEGVCVVEYRIPKA